MIFNSNSQSMYYVIFNNKMQKNGTNSIKINPITCNNDCGGNSRNSNNSINKIIVFAEYH